ncbi:MAG: DUF4380 domain-containing protein [Prolixibacteraceae bacterium]
MPGFTDYKSRKACLLENRWIRLYAVPQLGGRLIQLEMEGHEFFFVNPLLEGKEPGPTRLGENNTWLNFGGEKIWPAPQGWDSADQWPGPPDPVLDSGEYVAELADGSKNELRLTSPADRYTGLQIIREVSVSENRPEVNVSVTFKNTANTPKRWSVWPVMQMSTPGQGEGQYQVVCPANQQSSFRNGYQVMHGLVNNPQFSLNTEGNVQVDYQYLVGKIGMDADAGWAAFNDKETGKVLAVMFPYEKDKTYPNDTSFQVWTAGRGMVYSRNVVRQHADDRTLNPPYLELELLSPLQEIMPGKEVQFEYRMQASTIPAGETVKNVNETGVIASSFTWKPQENGIFLSAAYGVFSAGTLKIQGHNASGCEASLHETTVSPLRGIRIVLFIAREFLPGDFCVTARLFDADGQLAGVLDEGIIQFNL